MADQKYTGEKTPLKYTPVQGCDINNLSIGEWVYYTDPNTNTRFLATFVRYIQNKTGKSLISYDPLSADSASAANRAKEFEVDTKNLSCMPMVNAVQIPNTGKSDRNSIFKGTIATGEYGKPVEATANVVKNGANDDLPLASVVQGTPGQNNTELMDYRNRIDGKENEFDINILRNEANNGYKIQKITANKQDNGKYNMVTLDLDIGPNANDVDREVMKSKISRAIGTVLSNGAIGTENETTRDLTALYNAENTKAAADVSHEDVDNLFGNDLSRYKNQNPPPKPDPSTKPNGGKLSRKRKRNMTKSKKRKVGTRRRR